MTFKTISAIHDFLGKKDLSVILFVGGGGVKLKIQTHTAFDHVASNKGEL
jgi:hypothetical protein